jgi:hypothetical protein
LVRIKPKRHSTLAKARENNSSEFSKDTARQVKVLWSGIISIPILNNFL